MASVYLLHFPPGLARGGHFLGVAPAGELGTAGDSPPPTITHGAGLAACPPGAVVADVWDCATAQEADALARRLRRQGGHRRLCSVCSPGNGRGQGRGWYQRERARMAQKEVTGG